MTNVYNDSQDWDAKIMLHIHVCSASQCIYIQDRLITVGKS